VSRRVRLALVHAGLALLVLAVYGQVVGFEFVGLDDPGYVTENERVQRGLTPGNAGWAFTTFTQANWHPLTWLSLMLDADLGGGGPGVFHLTNLLLHLANTLLLFYLLSRMTGKAWRSAFVAAVFAVHPLHVESVAWISERKDVLSALFWMLAVLAYVRYVEKPNAVRYGLVLGAFALGLMTKPMLVTLPLALVLLDVWPLGRVRTGGRDSGATLRVLWEKIPLFAMSAASAAVTLLAQSAGGAVGALETFPLGVRVANALVSYVAYIGKTIWPAGLAVPYPYDPGSITFGRVLVSALVVVAVSIVCVRLHRNRPYLLVGWLWFLITLLPVIGLVQVGTQAMADRYTYVPHIGLFVAIVWAFGDLAGAFVRGVAARRALCGIVSASVIAALSLCAFSQAGHWRDSNRLFNRALEVTRRNAVAHNGLGLVLYEDGRHDEAIAQYREAVRISPRYVTAHINLAAALIESGRLEEAIDSYREALRHRPGDPVAREGLAGQLVNLGVSRMRSGDSERAEAAFRETLALDPDNASAHKNLGVILARRGDLAGAVVHFRESVRLNPEDEGATRNLQRAEAMLNESASR
jgi:Flp pilus assembly protein TadD